MSAKNSRPSCDPEREPLGPHVVHVTLAHQPQDVRIFEKEAATLATAGYRVSLAVPQTASREVSGVHFIPIASRADRRGAIAAPGRIVATAQTVGALRPSVVHLHDPELIPLGVYFALRGMPVIYDAHEDAPLEALTLNMARPVRGRTLSMLWRANLAVASRLFRGFVAATPDIAQTLPPDRTVLVRNYPRLDKLKPGPNPHERRPRRVAYVGNISEARGLFQLLDALASLPADDPAELVLMGSFRPASLEGRARAHPGWVRVRYAPWQSWDDVSRALDQSRVGICALHPTPELLCSLPVKLFEYLAKGLPVVASDFPAWRPLVGDAGVLIDPLDVAALRSAILMLLNDSRRSEAMGQAGVLRVRSHYSWDAEGDRLLSLYYRIVGAPNAAAPGMMGVRQEFTFGREHL